MHKELKQYCLEKIYEPENLSISEFKGDCIKA
ncbi:hypothetical protein IGL58_002643 [Enterococcus sp. AZ180]